MISVERAGSRFLAMVAIVVGALLAGCGAAPIQTVDPSLVGSWQGRCEVSLPIVFNPAKLPENVERTRRSVDLNITIHEDATVEGSVGEATIEESLLKRNRGDLGRRLNVASDYIIMDGHLSGPIVAGEDENQVKAFTIPFNVVDGHVQGSFMWLQKWKYPYPLCRVDIERSP